MYKFLIVGANFDNKGAQSMLFITVDEIKKRFPDAAIYYGGYDNFDERRYQFSQLYYTEESKRIAAGGVAGFTKGLQRLIKDTIKTLIGHRKNVYKAFQLKKIIPTLTAIIDISGFNLGEKWSIAAQQSYLNNIRLARKYSIPMYLMPQSFGPFDYDEEKRFLLDEIRDLLTYPRYVFAREEEGKRLLENSFGLTNVVLSTDLVLQNSGITLSNVFKIVPEINIPKISDCDNVGIVPNKQCLNFGNRDSIIKMYEMCISQILEYGKKVYIFRHSSEDLDFCRMIKERFVDNVNVIMLDRDFSCLEYDAFIQQFNFIICSRFHGIVHAYRNAIPCIALGWAIKYDELVKMISHDRFSFSIIDTNVDLDNLREVLEYMIKNHKAESAFIRRKVKDIQKDSCFSVLDDLT